VATPTKDLRDWIALLEREGELVRVTAEVDPELEITEIVDRTVKAGGPALLFERPKGSAHPLLINQFGTERRMCLAFGVERLDDVARKVSDVLEMQPPEGLLAKVRGLQKLKSIADSLPQTVRSGPVQEIVLQGDDDMVVPIAQAEEIVAALQRQRIPHAYLHFAGEGHGFRQSANIRRALEAELSFYAQVFGFELADDFEPVLVEHLAERQRD